MHCVYHFCFAFLEKNVTWICGIIVGSTPLPLAVSNSSGICLCKNISNCPWHSPQKEHFVVNSNFLGHCFSFRSWLIISWCLYKSRMNHFKNPKHQRTFKKSLPRHSKPSELLSTIHFPFWSISLTCVHRFELLQRCKVQEDSPSRNIFVLYLGITRALCHSASHWLSSLRSSVLELRRRWRFPDTTWSLVLMVGLFHRWKAWHSVR